MKPLPLLCAVALLALLPASSTLAQEKTVAVSVAIPTDITATQLAQIRSLLAAFDKKVEAGFVGEGTLRTVMTKELKVIEATKDLKLRQNAILAYQKKHGDSYRRVLKKGGADISALAVALNRILPTYSFTAVNGTHVIAKARSRPLGNLTLPSKPATQTLTLRDSNFRVTKDLGCGLIAGSNVTFSNLRLKNDAWSAVAGGCENTGDTIHLTAVPAGMTAVTTANVNLYSEANAVSVVGGSLSTGLARATLKNSDERISDTNFAQVFIIVSAPVLWAAFDRHDDLNIPMQSQTPEGKSVSLETSTYTREVSAIGAGTYSAGTVELLNPRIVLAPQ